MINYILYFFLLLICSILFHELGHWLYATRTLKKKVFINFGFIQGRNRIMTGLPGDWDAVNKKHMSELSFMGMLFGLFPIILSVLFIPGYEIISLACLVPYAIGCNGDLKEWLKTQ